MTSERIGGIKLNVEKLTDSELFNVIQYTQERRDQAEADLERLVGVAAVRGLVEVQSEDS